ncbi:MAG TPA: CAP domain-containing protein [Pyrinomonadaceae bacterium]|jgi:uncharacterized protein YkwD|nr:CAP domain-containing protein [Pyrinomonadaceae bacterium]
MHALPRSTFALPIFFLGFAFLSLTSFAQNNAPVPIRLASADNIEDLFRPRRVVTGAVNVKSVEHAAFDLVNRKREESGLQPLIWSDELETVARLHSGNMAEFQFFSHRGLDNKMVSDRADDAKVGTWRSIGENIAFNRGFQDPITKAVDLWLDSPGHRRNMLNCDWKESAIGVAVAEDGSYYFTQVFLARR